MTMELVFLIVKKIMYLNLSIEWTKVENQNVSNSGLGLATTKSLLNSINGKISLHDSYLGGLEVAIEIPN